MERYGVIPIPPAMKRAELLSFREKFPTGPAIIIFIPCFNSTNTFLNSLGLSVIRVVSLTTYIPLE